MARRGRRVGQCGFTLLELVIALAVLGVLIAIARPSLQRWKETIDLRSAASRLGELMLTARMRSVVDRRTYTVSVDYASGTCATSPSLGMFRAPGSVDVYYDDTDPDCPSLSGQNVDFRANGAADAAGFEAVYLRSKSARVAVRYRVKVLGATGKVSLERWLGGSWVGVN
jgi:prepilin-type N-terminal cleavage/methylation domain-containing protein